MFPNDTDFDAEFTFENTAVPLPDEAPFQILLLGDWSGNSSRKDLDERYPIEIDRDNFDDILKRLNVRLDLDLHGDRNNVLQLQFTELDDFHPDNIFRKVSLFSDLRDVRRRLLNSDTFDRAANQVRSWFNSTDENSPSKEEIQKQIQDAPPIDSNNLLEMILTQPSESVNPLKAQPVDNSALSRFVSNIVSPYLIKIDENEQSTLLEAVDETISELMRTILHHKEFQALESAWRGLYFLIRRVETSAQLKIFILDISQDEIAADLKSVDDLQDSFLYRQFYSETFAVIGGNFNFGVNVDDIASLLRIGKLANSINSPFISYIKPEIFGIKDFSENIESNRFNVPEDSKELKLWTVLRSSSEASYIGLSPMKILIRMPYGNATEDIESFSFEEFKGEALHKKLLWANPCFGVILLLARSFNQIGWEFGNNLLSEIEGLPMYIYREDGKTNSYPSVEIVLTESLLEKLLDQGFIPLVSYRDSNRVRLGRLQSVSFSDNALKGKWEKVKF